MRSVTLFIATLLLATPVLTALADSNDHDKSGHHPVAAQSRNDDGAARQYAFWANTDASANNAAEGNAGKWACIARSTYGTHGTATVWSAYTPSRSKAERSALEKCDFSAVNKQDCRVSRCWIEGSR